MYSSVNRNPVKDNKKQMHETKIVGDGTGRSGDGDRGRSVALTAAADAQQGDLVLQTPPLAKVLMPELWGSHCHHCFTTESAKLSRCGQCRTAYYCALFPSKSA